MLSIVAFRSAKGNGDYRRLAATAYVKASPLILYANQDKSHLVLVGKIAATADDQFLQQLAVSSRPNTTSNRAGLSARVTPKTLTI